MANQTGARLSRLQVFSLVPGEEKLKMEYRVLGTAIVFNTPTVLWECDGVRYKGNYRPSRFRRVRYMSDVIFNATTTAERSSLASETKRSRSTSTERGMYRRRPRRNNCRARALRGNRRQGRRSKCRPFLSRCARRNTTPLPIPALSQRSRSYTTCRRWIFPYNDTSSSAQAFPRRTLEELAALEQARGGRNS